MATAAIIIGTTILAASEIRKGQAAANAATFNAAIARQNAQISLEQANEVERRHRIMARKNLGTARARIGGAGIAFEGSALDFLEETTATAEMDALTIKHAGQIQNLAFLNQASLELFKGEQAKKSSQLSAVGTLLGGAGRLGAGVRGTPQSSLSATQVSITPVG